MVLIVFNRPGPTKRVFERIARARPSKLLVIADGPRSGRAGEPERCAETRDLIRPTWPCELLTNYSDVNLGCKARVSSGLTWAFEQVEEAIILEDDCLPEDSFFEFCRQMLERYREDERVMMVSGDSFQPSRSCADASYGFTRWAHIWGWASWRRAWNKYDVSMTGWPEFRGRLLRAALRDPVARRYWRKIFDDTHGGSVDTWDNQWTFTLLSQSGLSIEPRANLVTNIGFGSDATHTVTSNGFESRATAALEFPLVHPKFVIADAERDERLQRMKQSILRRAYFKVAGLMSRS